MANASAKRTATQNESAVKILKLGLLLPTVVSFLLRLAFRRSSLPPSKSSLAVYVVTFLPAFFLNNYLRKIGTTRRNSDGTLISSGEDLSQQGVTEWAFDIIYVTWICQIGSGALGDWFWWFYLVIPLYAGFKVWTKFIAPNVGGPPASIPASVNDAPIEEAVSKRQEKLKRRGERGDARIRRK